MIRPLISALLLVLCVFAIVCLHEWAGGSLDAREAVAATFDWFYRAGAFLSEALCGLGALAVALWIFFSVFA